MIQSSAGLAGEHSSRLFQVRSPRFLHRQETLTNTPGIHHDNTSTWLFPSPHGGRHAFRVSYDDIFPTSRSLFTIRDLPFFTPTHSAFPSALNAFLHQFNNVSFRWKNDYEPLTADLLRLCSQYQEGILSLLPVPPKDLAGGETLIALALRCLTLTYDVAETSHNCPWRGFMDNFVRVDGDNDGMVLLEAGVDPYYGMQPSITVWK